MTSPIALSFFNFASSSSSASAGIGADLLTAWASSRVAISNAAVADARADPNAPTAPWEVGYPMPEDEALAESALNGGKFFDIAAAQYADESVEGDYARLFALHSGLKTLSALATQLENDKLNSVERARIEKAFARGQAELQTFLDQQKFENVRVALGDRADEVMTKLGIQIASEDYTTRPIHRGSLTDTISGLDPNAQFDIVVTRLSGAVHTVSIDLAQMGSLPRSLNGVVSFINQRLVLAGVETRVKAEDLSPKTTEVKVGGQTFTRPYTGLHTYALKVDVRAGEKVAFEAPSAATAFYVAGQTASGGRLIKLEDVFGAAGEPDRLQRPAATDSPANAAAGFIGAGAPYTAPPAGVWTKLTGALVSSSGDTTTEASLAEAGEAQVTLAFADGRTLTVTTAWRDEEIEEWRVRSGESEELGRLDDLAERLTQLLHEQGVAAGIDLWTDVDGNAGFALSSNDHVRIDKLTIGARSIALEDGDPPSGGLEGGLRAGVFARRFEIAALGDSTTMFQGVQTFTFASTTGSKIITIDGGEFGLTAEALAEQLNTKLAAQGVAARASFENQAGQLALHIDALHEMNGVSAKLNDAATQAGALLAPGAWANGGLPVANPGAPFAEARRTSTAGSAPLSAPGNEGALDIAITVATGVGDKVVSLSISATDRANDPDIAPGQWSAALQARLDQALNAAGIYASSDSLNAFTFAEASGQRLKSVTINGQDVAYTAQVAANGGAFDEVRSLSSDQIAAQTNDVLGSLTSDPSISLTFDTIWGERVISANLEPGDPRTLESAAQRLNEAIAAAGYDISVEAANLAVGAGLRFATGSSFTVSNVTALSIGGASATVTLDAIDAAARADDPPGAEAVAQRAARGAAALLITPLSGSAPYTAPTINATGWFAGRAFDVSLGDGAKILAVRGTAAAADGSVYVLADIENLAGDQPIKGERDVALLRYDPAGNLIFQRTLGAAEEAQGFSLAVSVDGKVAIAGAVTGGLGATAQGGADSFVTMFDANGAEMWTQRRGAKADDQVSALAFSADGVLFVAGQTKSALGAQIHQGGADAYLRAYSSAGVELFTSQFGSSGDDAATAIALRDAGGGAIEITLGGVESGRGTVRQFTYAAATGLAAGLTRDIGAFRNGATITSIVVESGAIHIGGAVEADKLTVANNARAAISGLEGFVARISTNLASTALDRSTYLGSSQDDRVSSLAVVDGVVYAAGSSSGVVAGAARKGTQDGFLARLDDGGDIAWLRNFNTIGGNLGVTGMTVAANAASPLDRLGLPAGSLAAADSTKLVDRAALRAGDEFYLSVNGATPRRITVTANDTLRTLTSRIDALLGARGDAVIERDGDVERIVITAKRGDAISLTAGAAHKDALAGLGLAQGIIAFKPTADNPARTGELRSFGLGIQANDLQLHDAAAIKRTKAEISAALSILRQAYTALADPASLDKTDEELEREERMAGAVPEYLQTQLQNYAMGLLKLSGSY